MYMYMYMHLYILIAYVRTGLSSINLQYNTLCVCARGKAIDLIVITMTIARSRLLVVVEIVSTTGIVSCLSRCAYGIHVCVLWSSASYCTYRIAGEFGGELNLAVCRSSSATGYTVVDVIYIACILYIPH